MEHSTDQACLGVSWSRLWNDISCFNELSSFFAMPLLGRWSAMVFGLKCTFRYSCICYLLSSKKTSSRHLWLPNVLAVWDNTSEDEKKGKFGFVFPQLLQRYGKSILHENQQGAIMRVICRSHSLSLNSCINAFLQSFKYLPRNEVIHSEHSSQTQDHTSSGKL